MAERTFEDDFMDVQAGLVSLCLEATEGMPVRDVYIYVSLEGNMTVFNAFFRMRGLEANPAEDRVLPLNQVVLDDDVRWQVIKLAQSDLDGLRRLCDAAGHPCPTQIRGHYSSGGAYKASYEYDRIVSKDDGTGVAPGATFAAWMHAVASGNDDLA